MFYLFIFMFVIGCNLQLTSSQIPEVNPAVLYNTPDCPETSLPWDVGWIPVDTPSIANRINTILEGSGLAGQGTILLNLVDSTNKCNSDGRKKRKAMVG